jgi:alkylation response protein AidB-like acyl-CoA dehydrogenase
MSDYLELDLTLPAELRELKQHVHRFAQEVLRPAACALDRLAQPEQVIAPGSQLWDFLRQAYALGYHAVTVPVEYGGLGLRGLGLHIFLEELGWGGADLAISLGVASFPFSALAMTGNPKLIDQFVKPFVQDREARFVGCWPITEPEHGSDWAMTLGGDYTAAAAGRASLTRDGDGYVIRGQKSAWVSNGTIATHGLTYLMSPAQEGRPAGGAVAFVPFDLPGVSKGKPLNKLGQRALNQGEIFFDGVRIPAEYVLVTPETFEIAYGFTLAGANGTMGAVFTGLARSAFEAALDYSRQRVQGGVPICQHQLVQKHLFEMFTKVEASRALSRAALAYNDAVMAPALEYAIASKTFCTQAAFEVASDALQMFGGNGLSREYPIEKIFRDARASLIEDGTNDVLSLAGAEFILARAATLG